MHDSDTWPMRMAHEVRLDRTEVGILTWMTWMCVVLHQKKGITDRPNADLHLDIGNGVSLEKVDEFCYSGDVLDADTGCDSAVIARVRSAWKKFHEYLPILTGE